VVKFNTQNAAELYVKCCLEEMVVKFKYPQSIKEIDY
jgi:hypothetical protein